MTVECERVVNRLMRDIRAGVYQIGHPIPMPRELAARYGVSRDAAAQALRVLADRKAITLMGDKPFAGSPDVILADDYRREYPLCELFGEYFSLRRAEPGLPLHMGVWFFPGEKQTRMHSHDFIEITLIVKGAGSHVYNGVRYPLDTGDCFAVLPDQRHAYESASGMDLVVVDFYPDELDPVYERISALPGFPEMFTLGPLGRSEGVFHGKVQCLSEIRFARGGVPPPLMLRRPRSEGPPELAEGSKHGVGSHLLQTALRDVPQTPRHFSG